MKQPKIRLTIKNRTDGDTAIRSEAIDVALSTRERMQGLLGVRAMVLGSGLLIPDCSSIHMWGMKMALDIVFLKRQGREWRVVKLVPNVRPWKLLPVGAWGANDVLELAPGTVELWNLKEGETLCIA